VHHTRRPYIACARAWPHVAGLTTRQLTGDPGHIGTTLGRVALGKGQDARAIHTNAFVQDAKETNAALNSSDATLHVPVAKRPRRKWSTSSVKVDLSKKRTERIRALSTTEDVARLHAQLGHSFDDFNLIAAWTQVGSLTAGWRPERIRGLLGPNLAPPPERRGSNQYDPAATAAHAATLTPPGRPSGGGSAVGTLGPSSAHDGSALLAPLARQIYDRLPHMSPRALTNAAHVAMKLSARPLLEATEAPLIALAHTLPPRLLSEALGAFASSRVQAPAFYDRAKSLLLGTDVLSSFNPHELALTCSSFSRSGNLCAQLFAAISHHAAVRVEEFPAKDLAVLTISLGAACPTGPSHKNAPLDWLVQSATVQLEKGAFDPRTSSKLAAAFARSGTMDPSFFDALLGLRRARLEMLDDQALCELILAFSKAGYLHGVPRPPLPGAPVAGEIARSRRTERKGPLQLTDRKGTITAGSRRTSCALASRLSLATQELALARLLSVAQGRVPSLKPDEMAFLAWAFAPSKLSQVPALLEGVQLAVRPRLRELSSQALSMLGWAHAVAYVPSAPLLGEIADVAASRLGEMQPQGIVMLLWASALVGADASKLIGKVEAMPESALNSFLPASLTMMAWTLIVNRTYPPRLLRALVARINTTPAGAFSRYSRMQLYQLQTALELEVPGLELAVRAELLPPHSANVVVESSATHGAISRALSALGIGHTNEHLVPSVAYPVDIALDASRHVLQVNGPMHYLPDSQQPGRKMLFVRRHLERAGWCVVDIPFWEVDTHLQPTDLHGHASKQLKGYLQRLLEEHGALQVAADGAAADGSALLPLKPRAVPSREIANL